MKPRQAIYRCRVQNTGYKVVWANTLATAQHILKQAYLKVI